KRERSQTTRGLEAAYPPWPRRAGAVPRGARPIEPTQPRPAQAKHRNRLTDERLTAFLNLYVSNGFLAVKACIGLGMTHSMAHAHRYVEAIRSGVRYNTPGENPAWTCGMWPGSLHG